MLKDSEASLVKTQNSLSAKKVTDCCLYKRSVAS